MTNKKYLFSMVALGVLLVCSFACAQESSKEQPKKEGDQVAALDQTRTTSVKTETKTIDNNLSPEEIKKVSEAFGNFIGKNLKSPGIVFDMESIITGIRNGYNGKPSPMTEKEYQEAMTKIQEHTYKQLAATNLKAAEEFLTKNSKEQGIVELVPGKLQYKDNQQGTGETVQEHFSPQINYTGKFIDGSSFGSSSESGGPITIPLDQTIPGFSKGIVGMKEGGKRTLYVHPELGYGTTGQLPPNSLLIFEVELVKANAPENVEDDVSDEEINEEDTEETTTPSATPSKEPASTK